MIGKLCLPKEARYTASYVSWQQPFCCYCFEGVEVVDGGCSSARSCWCCTCWLRPSACHPHPLLLDAFEHADLLILLLYNHRPYLCASISLHPLHHSVTWDMHFTTCVPIHNLSVPKLTSIFSVSLGTGAAVVASATQKLCCDIQGKPHRFLHRPSIGPDRPHLNLIWRV